MFKQKLTLLIRITIFFLTMYVFVFSFGIFSSLSRTSDWVNDRYSACFEDCDFLGELKFIYFAPRASSRVYSTAPNAYSGRPDSYKLELNYLLFQSHKKGISYDRVCIDKIVMGDLYPALGENILPTPLCKNLELSTNGSSYAYFDFTKLNTPPPIFADLVSSDYDPLYYPFSKFTSEVFLQFIYHFEENKLAAEEQTLYPSIIIEYANIEDWDLTIINKEDVATKSTLINLDKNSDMIEGPVTFLQIAAEAPSFYKIPTAILILGILILVFSTFLITDTPIFVQTVVGILFGMYGLKQVLMPQNAINTITIVDFSYLILYIIIVYSIFDHIAVKFIKTRNAKKEQLNSFISAPASLLFHKEKCPYAKNISKRSAIYFSSEKEAKASNKKSCSYCLPSN